MIEKGDILFTRRVLMPWAGIRRLALAVSSSQKKWPDIWVEKGMIPQVTVTREWLRQNVHERRKRLVHEFLHIQGMGHGRYGQYDFNTKPALDTYSMATYRRMLK